ncbi:MAG TPA: ABC transporter permease [Acidimicrobiia bacterium]|jgi:ABC transporter DrrB family efflux protein
MTAITTPVTRGAARGASMLRATRSVARRTTRKFLRTPQLVVVGTIQGAMFLLIFRYVFGGAINGGGVPYVDFLVPGFVTTSVLFVGMSTAAGIAEDLEQGFVDRLRSLPIPRAAVLAGRALADSQMLVWNLAITVAIGFAVGFRLHGSVAAGIAAFALCALFGFAFTWLFILLGLVAGNAQAAQGMSLLVFPLTFVSSAYVQVRTMPGWMQAFAEHQPITPMVDAVRGLCLGGRAHEVLGHGPGYDVVSAIVWSAALVVVFGALAVMRFRRV